MKVLCPNCGKAVELSEVESHSVQMGRCAKCNIMIHATFDQRGSGRKVWDLHLEQPKTEKKKGFGLDGKVLLLVILFVFALAIIMGTFNGWLTAE
jgi:hypothetical protein